MAVRVTLDVSKLRALQRDAAGVLRALDAPLRDGVRRALDMATFLAPVGDPGDDSNLRETGFISGPSYNLGPRLSATWTAGFAHPAAGAIHEGFHWGVQTQQPPPHFLRKPFRRSRAATRKGVAATLAAYLARHFPKE